jgi:hypothetical protein
MSAHLILRQKTARTPITSLYLKACNASLRENRGEAELPTDQQHVHVLTLRLRPSERTLLDEMKKRYLPAKEHSQISDSASSYHVRGAAAAGEDELGHAEASSSGSFDRIACFLFFHWSWTSAVLRQVLTEFEPGNLSADHAEGGQAEAWEMVKTLVRTRYDEMGFDRRNVRTDELLSDPENAAFVAAVMAPDDVQLVDHTRITVQPHPEDVSYWRLMALLFREYSDSMSTWPGFRAAWDMLQKGSAPESEDSAAQEQAGDADESDGLPPEPDLDKEGITLRAAQGPQTDNGQAMVEGTDWASEDSDTSMDVEENVLEGTSEPETKDHVTKERRREHMLEYSRQDVQDMLNASDVLDIWVMARQMRTCEINRGKSIAFQELYTFDAFAAEWKTVKISTSDNEEDGFFQGHFRTEEYKYESLVRSPSERVRCRSWQGFEGDTERRAHTPRLAQYSLQ